MKALLTGLTLLVLLASSAWAGQAYTVDQQHHTQDLATCQTWIEWGYANAAERTLELVQKTHKLEDALLVYSFLIEYQVIAEKKGDLARAQYAARRLDISSPDFQQRTEIARDAFRGMWGAPEGQNALHLGLCIDYKEMTMRGLVEITP